MAGFKTTTLADFLSGNFTGTMGENGQMINQSIPDYIKAAQDFQTNAAGKIDPMGGTPYTFGAALPYFDKNTMNAQDWLGGTDPQKLLDSKFSNSGAIGPWAPKYNPQTGEVSYYADNSTNEFQDTILKFAALIAGGGAMGAAGAGAGAAEGAGAGGSIFAADASPGAFGWGGGEALGGGGAVAGGAGAADAAWGVNPATTGGSMDLGDWQDFSSFLGDSGSNFVGDIPTTGDIGGTSIYGANPSISDIYSQYQLSGQNPTDFLKNLTGLPNTPPGISNLVKQFLGGDNSASTLKMIGSLLSAGLGAFGANRQANATNTLAQQYAGYGAPYRAMLAQSYADPAAFLKNSPDIQASVGQGTDALARSLSTQGNPTGSGAALQQLQNYATQGLYGQLGNERNRLANFGGLSNFNAAAPGLAGQAITQQGNVLNAIGSGISSVTNPPTTLEQALNALNSNNFKLNSGTGLA